MYNTCYPETISPLILSLSLSLSLLCSDLCTTFHPLLCTESNEDRIGHFNEDVVDTVHMDVAYSTRFHVRDDPCPLVGQRSIEPSISVGGSGQLVTISENDLTIEFKAGKRVLLKDNHIRWVETKIPENERNRSNFTFKLTPTHQDRCHVSFGVDKDNFSYLCFSKNSTVGSRVCSLVMMYLKRKREMKFTQQMFKPSPTCRREATPPLICISDVRVDEETLTFPLPPSLPPPKQVNTWSLLIPLPPSLPPSVSQVILKIQFL